MPGAHPVTRPRQSLGAPPKTLKPATLSDHNLAFIEALYAQYLRDPHSVEAEWRRFFEREFQGSPAPEGPTFRPGSLFHKSDGQALASKDSRPRTTPRQRERDMAIWQDRVDQLVRAFRTRGHISAHLDPLARPRPPQAELSPEFYGFTAPDLKRSFSTDTIHGEDMMPLATIIQRLKHTYCRSIGVEFMHIDEPAVTRWLQDRMESTENRLALSRQEQLRILTKLTDAVMLEEFIQKRFLGAKSFSLEGAESLIPLLDLAIEAAGAMRVDEIVLAMAHRGRLNVLANIMGKPPQDIFREFEDIDPELHLGRGDVKYHLGHSTDWRTASGHPVHISLCFNPSHLEFVNPVALGRLRAKQDLRGDTTRERSVAILIHGDAAFAGEGIVQETFNLSELRGYTTGGAIHIVVNNQLGFTTPPSQGRSTPYATDVAKMLPIPIFHVNGEDPEAVAQVVRLAMDFRRQFQRDVVIDMYCYRRRGHNEGDEPAFTQPLMYRAIDERPGVREAYLEHLLLLGGITVDEADRIEAQRRQLLESHLSAARSRDYVPQPATSLGGIWSGYLGGPENQAPEVETRVSRQRLSELLDFQARPPEGFRIHPTLARLMKARAEMAAGARPLDWASAEALAIATLATEGVRVRFSGQDSERGTFSQRHAVLHDAQTGETYTPLAHLSPDQAPVEFYNSPLSEAAVLGMDYGYSLDCPRGLILWEAQFGDFVNVAQVFIDQFIASAEEKWRRLSGLVLLLPHGFEGQGPEHSSGRLERFLALCSKDNMQVVNLTTPAQYFHCLRRQALRPWRKPLVVMSPKSLLRLAHAVSSLDDLAEGRFTRVIPDQETPADQVSRVLICSGKVYYELRKRREELDRKDVAIVRVEQLYPAPFESLRRALSSYPDGTPAYWVQEEPENMGAWRFVLTHFGRSLFDRLPLGGVFRPSSASPATGSTSSHRLEQQRLLDQAFGKSTANVA